jgi:hypothetical protein
VPPCSPLLRDPAVISTFDGGIARAADGSGSFSFHARLIPSTPIDPARDGFIVTLSNANGNIFSAEVKPVDMVDLGARAVYRAPDLAAAARDGGITKLGIVRRTYAGVVGYGFRVKALGDFSRATLAHMTTQVYMGDDVGYVSAEWTAKSGRWVLHQRDYDSQP